MTTDKLTDEALERKSARFKAAFKDDEGASCKLEATISANQFEAINLVLWGAVDARAVIAMKDADGTHRRASQAAPAPSDGTCAECGCAPVNADSLCATCVDGRRAHAPSDALREADQSFVPLYCKGIPADCCDYAVVSLGKQREVCRVWDEADARLIASLLNRAALSTPTEERQ